MRKKFMPVFCAGVVFLGSILAGPAMTTATLIDSGMTTIDTATHLEWLDLTDTKEASFNEVSAELGIGGTWEGYQHASLSDVQTLFTHAGITPGMDGTQRPGDYGPVGNLLELMGVLKNEEPHGTIANWSWGLTSDIQPDGSTTAVQLYTLTTLPLFQGGATNTQLVSTDLADPALGSFLHRWTPIPEPSSTVLWFVTLAVMIVCRSVRLSRGSDGTA